jgi:hypothetical protein
VRAERQDWETSGENSDENVVEDDEVESDEDAEGEDDEDYTMTTARPLGRDEDDVRWEEWVKPDPA